MRIQQQELHNMMPALRQLDHQGFDLMNLISHNDFQQFGTDGELTNRI